MADPTVTPDWDSLVPVSTQPATPAWDSLVPATGTPDFDRLVPYNEYLGKLPESDIARAFHQDSKSGLGLSRKVYEDAYAARAAQANWTGSENLNPDTTPRTALEVLKGAAGAMWEGTKTQFSELGTLLRNNWAKPGTPEYVLAQEALGNVVQGMTKDGLETLHVYDRTASKLYNQLSEWGMNDPGISRRVLDHQFQRDVEMEATYDDLKKGVGLGLPEVGGRFLVDPEKVEKVSDTMLGVDSLIPGVAAFKGATKAETLAAKALGKLETKSPALAARMAAAPVEFAANLAGRAERIVGSSPLVRSAVAGGLAVGAGADVTGTLLSAIIANSDKVDKVLSGARLGLEGAARNLRDAGGPMSKFSAATYDWATGPLAKGIVSGTLANAPYALGAGSREEFKDALAIGAISTGLGIGAQKASSGLDIAANFFAPSDGAPTARTAIKDLGLSPTLDAEHRNVMSKINNDGNNFVEDIRSFFKKAGLGEVYAVSQAGFENALKELAALDPSLPAKLQGKDISQAAATQGVTLDVTMPDGKSRKIALFAVKDNMPGLGAGHESGHLIDKALSGEQRDNIYARLAEDYGPEGIEAARQKYAQDLEVDPKTLTDEYVLSELFAETASAVLNSVPIGHFGPNKKGWKQTARQVYGMVGEVMSKIGWKVPETAVKQEFKGEDGRTYTKWVGAQSAGPKTGLGFDPSIRGARAIENVLSAMSLEEGVFETEAPGTAATQEDVGEMPAIPGIRPAVAAPAFPKGLTLEGGVKDVNGKFIGDRVEILGVSPSTVNADQHQYHVKIYVGNKVFEADVNQSDLQRPGPTSGETPVSTEIKQTGIESVATPVTKPTATETVTPTQVENVTKPVATPVPTPPKNIHVTPAQQEAFAVKATPEVIASNIGVAQKADTLPQHEKQAYETDYYSARGETGEDAVVRESRRKLADAAEKTGKKNPLRAIYQKIFIPYRYVPGKTPRVFGFSYDKLIQNVDILKGWAATNKRDDLVARLSDPQFANTVRDYLRNQSNGYGGDGRAVTLPADTRPGSITTRNAGYTPIKLSPADTQLVNALMGIELPQKSSPASQFAARMARENGLTPTLNDAGVEVTNPLYLELTKEGFNPKLLNSVVENLPIDRMTTRLKARPDVQFPAGDVGITRAGFMPKTTAEKIAAQNDSLVTKAWGGMHAWMNPDGKLHPTGPLTHADWARLHHPIAGEKALTDSGWMRVTASADRVYLDTQKKNPTRAQLNEFIRLGIIQEKTAIQEGPVFATRVYEPPAAKFMPGAAPRGASPELPTPKLGSFTVRPERVRAQEDELSRHSSSVEGPAGGIVLHSAKLRSTGFLQAKEAEEFRKEIENAPTQEAKDDIIESYFMPAAPSQELNDLLGKPTEHNTNNAWGFGGSSGNTWKKGGVTVKRGTAFFRHQNSQRFITVTKDGVGRIFDEADTTQNYKSALKAVREALDEPAGSFMPPQGRQDWNIGLNVQGKEPNTVERVLEVLKAAGLDPDRYEVKQSGTEPTLVVRLPTASNETIAKISDTLGQDAVAVLNSDGVGQLLGSRAAAWGDFNPEFFLPLTQTAAERRQAVKDSFRFMPAEDRAEKLAFEVEAEKGPKAFLEYLEAEGHEYVPAEDGTTYAVNGTWLVDSEYGFVSPLFDWVQNASENDASTFGVTPQDFSKNFWENPPELFHATKPEKRIAIREAGELKPRADSKGISNRHSGAAVYTSTEPDEIRESYGDDVARIDTKAMKRDGYTPRVEQEPQIEENEWRGALAHKLGIEDFWMDIEAGMSPNTVVIRGKIPAKYITDADTGGQFLPAAKVQHDGKPLEHSLGAKTLNLIHYGGAGIEEVDPRNFGKSGLTTRSELSGLPRSYFYVQNKANLNDPVATRPNTYGAKVSGAKIYDGDADNLNYAAQINREKADEMLRKAGYVGISRSRGKYQQIELFDPTKVQPLSSPTARFLPAPPESKAFKDWFSDSKVVNKDGTPKVVYHGTQTGTDFAQFFTEEAGAHFGSLSQAEARIGMPKEIIDDIIERGDVGSWQLHRRVLPVYLRLLNPKRVKDTSNWADVVDQAKKEGHDGLVYKNEVEAGGRGGDSYVAFRPGQIKSAIGNVGQFDPTNPDVRFLPKASPRQETAFKDSKVRGPDGKLLPLFHGTYSEFKKFGKGDLGYHFGTQQAANARIGKALADLNPGEIEAETAFDAFPEMRENMPPGARGAIEGIADGARTLPVFLNIKNPLRMRDVGPWDDPEEALFALPPEVLKKLPYEAGRAVDVYKEWESDYSGPTKKFDEAKAPRAATALKAIREGLKSLGYDGVVYANQFEAPRTARAGEEIELTVRRAGGLWQAYSPEGGWLGKGNTATEARQDALQFIAENAIVPSADSYIAFDNAQIMPAFAQDAKARFLPAPPVESEAFKKFFSGSKTVNSDGSPQTLFHGTNLWKNEKHPLGHIGDFSVFDRDASAKYVREPGMDTIGSWFSDRPDNIYASSSPNNPGAVYPVYAAIKKPIELTFEQFLRMGQENDPNWASEKKVKGLDGKTRIWKTPAGRFDANHLRTYLQESGFDGIKFKDKKLDNQEQQVWVAFEPTQIKSAIGNVGTFDPSNPDIRYMPKVAVPGEGLQDVRDTRTYKNLVKFLTPDERENIRKDTAQKMLDIFNELPADEDFETAAKLGNIKKGWYKRAADSLQFIFGEDTERFVSLLAATSPRQAVNENLAMALAIWADWQDAGRPLDEASLLPIVKQHAEMHSRVPNSIRALQGHEIATPPLSADSLDSKSTLSGPKVDSFKRNLLGDLSASTNDTWMANFANLDQAIFGTKSGYLAFNAKVRKVAQKLDLQPAEVQETVWSFIKTLTEATTVDRPAQEALRSLTESDILQTPEFYEQIISDPKVKAQLERLGFKAFDSLAGFANPATARPGTLADLAVQEGGERGRLVSERIARRVQKLKDLEVSQESAVEPDDGSAPFMPAPLDVSKLTTSDNYAVVPRLDKDPISYGDKFYLTPGLRWIWVNEHEDAAEEILRELGIKSSYPGSENGHNETLQLTYGWARIVDEGGHLYLATSGPVSNAQMREFKNVAIERGMTAVEAGKYPRPDKIIYDPKTP